MRALRRLFARMVNFTKGRADRRLQEEMHEHLLQQTEENIRSGMNPAQARRQAALKFGSMEAIRESYHAERGLPVIEGLVHDVRYAARILSKSRAFTVVAATSLALAIGANTTIFSVARQLLYKRLAVPHAADLRLLTWTGKRDHVAVHEVFNDTDTQPGGLVTSLGFSYGAYQQLRTRNQVLGDLLVFHQTGMNAATGDDAQRVGAQEVSGNYYSVLGVKPQLGRGIEPSDDTPSSQPVAVISDGFWTSEFARSPAVIGRVIKLNDKPVTIVGVNPKEFTGAESTLPSETPKVTVALAMGPVLTPSADGIPWLTNPANWGLNVMGRMRPGVSESAAQTALNTQLAAFVRATMPVRQDEEIPRLVLRDGSRGLFGQKQVFAQPMSVLGMFVGLVLLLACANIANLMLARGAPRQREMGVRLALGAGRARILRQMLVESLLLATLGGIGGLAIGYFGRTAFARLAQNAWGLTSIPLPFDWQAFTFTTAVTVLAGVLSGIAPAFAATRAEVSSGLKESTPSATRRRRGVAGKALVGFQITLSMLLVIGAGLFVRSLNGLQAVNPGFRTDHLLLAEIPIPQNRYAGAASIAFQQRLEHAIEAIPGVESASPVVNLYLSDDTSDIEFVPEGQERNETRPQTEADNVVGTHFFETLGIPIVSGRSFSGQDTATSTKVGIINQSLARTAFPHQNPIGKRFSVGQFGAHGEVLTTSPIEIIGVCGDTRIDNLDEAPRPQFFVPYVQQTQVRRMGYDIRTRMSPEMIVPALRSALHIADPDLPLVNVRSQLEQIDSDMEEERLFVTLTSGFGMIALILASVGIYGVMAYSVAQRTNEIGIRMALGAIPRQVLAMVLREAGWLSVVGIAAGVGASFLLSRLIESMLYGIAPYDPATMVGAASLLLAVGLGASWIPARRAARVQPIEALRHD